MAQKFMENEAYEIFESHGLKPLEKYVNCKQKVKCINTGAKYISSALSHGRHYSGGYLWFYKDDYYNTLKNAI